MKDLIQHPEVEDEIEQQALYLGRFSDRAPFDFVAEIRAAFRQVCEHPTRYHFVYREYRRCNLPRFSHSIIYRKRADSIYVIAVMHEKRHPDYWKRRTQDDNE